MDFDKVLALFRALNLEEVDYIVFGALALNAHGIVRTTVDVDLFIRPTRENVDRLKRALRRVWDDPHLEEITAADLAGDYPAIQYGPPGEQLTIDLVARLGEAFRFEDLEWQTVPIEDVPVRVVTPFTLYRMKRDTVRTKDRADAEALRLKFGFEE
jgi:nucleotidyltransferase AbiEii toxin of type IV toxin-antitoxin system